ncbi:hypothetical protein H5410_037021 [Solanum commersonii]|uniref:Uncharacterized protein n=1 Tax=Solanum commersonii TaxID=4109 RepID=A0A9J5Y6K8_SOLCO|nr:hypothetical protein H5410_037021 [Solanum commersonii]
MTRTRSLTSLKNVLTSPSSSFEINLLSSDSSEVESVGPSSLTKKRPSAEKKKVSKKARFSLPDSLTDEDSLCFWGLEHKRRFMSFSKHPIVPGRVVNLEQLEASHCAVSTFFRAQKLSLLLHLCGLEFYEELVRLFYANLRVSADSGEWETLVLGNRIVLNDSLFKDVFGSDFSGDIPFMHGNLWPKNFENSLESAKLFVSETGANITNFGPLSLAFENHILAHIVATTLIPRKGSLSNISNRDVYVVYCMLKKLRINWALWFREYMVESLEDTNSSSSMPYGLLISRIIVDSLVDLSPFRPSLIDTTYDTRTFSSMGYVLINNKWYKKESVQQRADASKVLQDTLGKVLQLHKDSSTDVGKLCLEIEGLKKNVLNTLKYFLGHGRNQGKQNMRMSTKEGNKINQQSDSSRRFGDHTASIKGG